MKHLIDKQDLDNHIAYKHIYIENDKIVGMFTISILNDNPVATFESLWVNPEYRKLGLAHKMMKEICSTNIPMSCVVLKTNWVDKLYEKYGFDFWYDDDDNNYKWMKNFKIKHEINSF